MLITSRLSSWDIARSFAVSIQFYEAQLSETVRKRVAREMYASRRFGDAILLTMDIVTYHDMHRETFIAGLTEIQRTSSNCSPSYKPASMTSSRLISTGRAGNTGPIASIPERVASRSSAV
jgi:hypothetical protein